MSWSIDVLARAERIMVEGILEVHRRLEGTRLADHAGRIRETQNWIGGSDYNPCAAEFVPPTPEHVPALLEDLCAFSRLTVPETDTRSPPPSRPAPAQGRR